MCFKFNVFFTRQYLRVAAPLRSRNAAARVRATVYAPAGSRELASLDIFTVLERSSSFNEGYIVTGCGNLSQTH